MPNSVIKKVIQRVVDGGEDDMIIGLDTSRYPLPDEVLDPLRRKPPDEVPEETFPNTLEYLMRRRAEIYG